MKTVSNVEQKGPVCISNKIILKNKPMLNPNSYVRTSWNPYLEPRNLPKPSWQNLLGPSLGTLAWNLGTSWDLLGTLELPETFPLLGMPFWNPHLQLLTLTPGSSTWNPSLEPLGTLLGTSELSLGTLTWNLGTSCILYLEPLLENSEPSGTLTWNLGTLEPCGMTAPECPGPRLAETPKLSAIGEF